MAFEQQFGEPWHDDLKDVPRGATPTTKTCMHCGERIRPGDQGVQMNATRQLGDEGKTLAPLHRDCIEPFLTGEQREA